MFLVTASLLECQPSKLHLTQFVSLRLWWQFSEPAIFAGIVATRQVRLLHHADMIPFRETKNLNNKNKKIFEFFVNICLPNLYLFLRYTMVFHTHAGLSHSRTLTLSPSPQRGQHELQGFQAPQFPSTSRYPLLPTGTQRPR